MTETQSSTRLLAIFQIGERCFALEAEAVQEVIRLGAITPVRHAPPEVAGVMNLRGRIVTLLDTGLILGLGTVAEFHPVARGPESRILILEDRGEFLGLIVDRVDEVVEADPDSCEPLPVNVPAEQARYLSGVCRAGERVITLLHRSTLLSGTAH